MNELDIINWFEDAATRCKEIAHTPEKARFARNIDELLEGLNRKIPCKEFTLVLEDPAGRVSGQDMDSPTDLNSRGFMILKRIKENGWKQEDQVYADSKAVFFTLLSKMRMEKKAMYEYQDKTSVMRYFDLEGPRYRKEIIKGHNLVGIHVSFDVLLPLETELIFNADSWHLEPLPTPNNVEISNITATSMDLNWESNIENPELVKEVELNVSGDHDATIPLPAQTDSYQLTGLNPTSDITVQAKNKPKNPLYVESQYSEEVTAKTKTILSTPTDIQISNISHEGADITWDNNSEAGDQVEKVVLHIGSSQHELSNNAESYSATGLDPETNYAVSVERIAAPDTDYLDSEESAPAQFDTDPAPIQLSTITGLNLTNVAETTMTLNFTNPNGGNEDSNQVEISEEGGAFTVFGSATSGATSLPLTGLTQGYRYRFRITAIGSGIYLDSLASDEVEQYAKLEKTSTPSTSAVGVNSMTLSWVNPAGGVAENVRLYYRASSISSSWSYVELSGTSSSHALSGLIPNVQYQTYTQRFGHAGQPTSVASNYKYQNTNAYGGPVITTWGNDKSPSQNVEIDFSGVSGCSEYYIWVSTNGSSWSYVTQRTSTSLYSFDPRSRGAVSGQPLYVRVAAGVSLANSNNPSSAYSTNGPITYS